MRYSKVYVDAIGYELPPVVVTSAELEARLGAVYEALRIPEGQLEALTGIVERRWWDEGYPVSEGAVAAGRRAAGGAGGPGRRWRRRPSGRGRSPSGSRGGSAASCSSRPRPAASPPGWGSARA